MGLLLILVVAIAVIWYFQRKKQKEAEEKAKYQEIREKNQKIFSNSFESSTQSAEDEISKIIREVQAQTAQPASFPVQPSKKEPEPIPGKMPQDYLDELQRQKEKREAENAHYDFVVLDIEATSYERQYVSNNDILQISIIDPSGNVLIDQYCKPRRKTEWVRAYSVNAIPYSLVKDCPCFSEVKPYVQDIFNRTKLVITFDYNFVYDFLEKYKFDMEKFHIDSPVYRLRRYNAANGIENPKWTTLEMAARQIGISYDFDNSLEDAKAILALYNFFKEKDAIFEKERKKRNADKNFKNIYKPNKDADPSNALYGKKIVFADELPISRQQAFEKASALGAVVRSTISPTLDILVCGTRSKEWAYEYGKKSSEQKKVEKLNSDGANIKIISGDAFMKMLEQPAGVSTVDTKN